MLTCPSVTEGGICSEECGPSDPCGEGELCCSNGCGHVCKQGLCSNNQSINQSINQPITEVINHSIHQSINEQINQSANQSLNHSIKWSSINQSVS